MKEVCGNHTEGQALAAKLLRQGYAPVPCTPAGDLTSVTGGWPFAKWGIDIISPIHNTPRGFKFAIVVVDHYTKWVEAEALTTVTNTNCANFILKSIVCRFGVPHSLVSDNA